jgi:hypothetical protein
MLFQAFFLRYISGKGCDKTSYMLEKAAIEPVTLLMEVHLAHPSSTRGILCRPIFPYYM